MSQQNKNKDSSAKISDKSNSHSEQQFTILPHPAVRDRSQTPTCLANRTHPQKTNNPRDLEPPQPGAGLTSKPEIAAHHAHGPQILNQDITNSLEKPAVSANSPPWYQCAARLTLNPCTQSREELRKRAEELNK
jgi:hypothetical protein